VKAGFWLFGGGGACEARWVAIGDHEQAMRHDHDVAQAMGISERLLAELSARHRSREEFLVAIMQRAAIRVRGHLTHVSVEYWAHAKDEPKMLAAIAQFAEAMLAETSLLRLVNLRLGTERYIRAGDLLREVSNLDT